MAEENTHCSVCGRKIRRSTNYVAGRLIGYRWLNHATGCSRVGLFPDRELGDSDRGLNRAWWVAGYAAALEFCADSEGRLFWRYGDTAEQAAEAAWEATNSRESRKDAG